jgi:hypothetical protein
MCGNESALDLSLVNECEEVTSAVASLVAARDPTALAFEAAAAHRRATRNPLRESARIEMNAIAGMEVDATM